MNFERFLTATATENPLKEVPFVPGTFACAKKMGADEFRDHIPGSIFYKYLFEKIHLYANDLLTGESITEFTDLSLTPDHHNFRTKVIYDVGTFIKVIAA